MAKIKWGALVVDGRGKTNGHVLSKNRAGAYIRTKVTPVNPQTVAQMAVRSLFASISQKWRALTQAQRNGFNSAVSDFAKTDIFGDLRNPSGKNLFQRLNQNLGNTGQAQITAVPAVEDVPFTNLSDVNGVAATGALIISATALSAGSKVLVFATPQMSAGITYHKNQLRVIKVVDSDDLNGDDIGSAYIAKFGTLKVGANIFVGARVVTATGQTSPMSQVKAVVI